MADSKTKSRKRIGKKALDKLVGTGAAVKFHPQEVAIARFDELLSRLDAAEKAREKAHKEVLAALLELPQSVQTMVPDDSQLSMMNALLSRLEEVMAPREPVPYNFDFDRDELNLTTKIRATPILKTTH